MVAKKGRKIKKNYAKVLSKTLILLSLLFLVFFLILTNIKVRQKRNILIARIESLREDTIRIEGANLLLRERIEGLQEEDYLEKVAREHLGLGNPGEEVVYITREDADEDIKKNKTEEENNGWWGRVRRFFNF